MQAAVATIETGPIHSPRHAYTDHGTAIWAGIICQKGGEAGVADLDSADMAAMGEMLMTTGVALVNSTSSWYTSITPSGRDTV